MVLDDAMGMSPAWKVIAIENCHIAVADYRATMICVLSIEKLFRLRDGTRDCSPGALKKSTVYWISTTQPMGKVHAVRICRGGAMMITDDHHHCRLYCSTDGVVVKLSNGTRGIGKIRYDGHREPVCPVSDGRVAVVTPANGAKTAGDVWECAIHAVDRRRVMLPRLEETGETMLHRAKNAIVFHPASAGPTAFPRASAHGLRWRVAEVVQLPRPGDVTVDIRDVFVVAVC